MLQDLAAVTWGTSLCPEHPFSWIFINIKIKQLYWHCTSSERHDDIGSQPSSQTFVAQLNPAALLILDDTDTAVETTLRMASDSKAGFYSNSASPSRQVTSTQTGVLIPDDSSSIPLSDLTSSTVGRRRLNASIVTADLRGEESATTATASAAGDDVPPIRRANTESGDDHVNSFLQLTHPRNSSKKAALLLIMFIIQAAFYVLFAVTLAGVGARFLSGIPAIISFVGAVIAVATVIINFGIQVKEGRGAERTWSAIYDLGVKGPWNDWIIAFWFADITFNYPIIPTSKMTAPWSPLFKDQYTFL